MKKVAYLTLASLIAFYAGQASAAMIKDDKICTQAGKDKRNVASHRDKFDVVGDLLNSKGPKTRYTAAKKKKSK